MTAITAIKRIVFSTCLCLPLVVLAQATLRLPSILSDHMLLQQNAEVKLWGWADPRTAINIIPSWSKDTIKLQASEKAKWETMIRTPSAGGPYTIHFSADNKNITINDVLIGELWLCSGQSNMEFNVEKGVIDAKEALADCTNNEIRFFFVEKATAEYPQDDCEGYWRVCTPESMRWFSSVGYFFGKRLNDELKVPVGLINSNWGGTAVETWMPENKITDLESVKQEAKLLKESASWDNTVSSTYNAMIYPLTKMKIAGVIWYQGESNCPNAYSYSKLFTNMIKSWREEFQSELPFYYVQIAPYLRYPIPLSAALVREQQEQVLKVPKTGMVIISDLVENLHDIHPKYKKEVGNRLANYALAETYNRSTPKYQFATLQMQGIENQKIRVYFNKAEGGIIYKGDKIEGLEIAGKDNIFYPAEAVIDRSNNTLLVSSKEVMEPVSVRYAFANGVVGNLFDKTGLPVAPFRTDHVLYNLNSDNK